MNQLRRLICKLLGHRYKPISEDEVLSHVRGIWLIARPEAAFCKTHWVRCRCCKRLDAEIR